MDNDLTKATSAINYQRIKKDCFWDLIIKDCEIDDIINGSDLRKKAFLFEKILLNSTKLLLDLNIFKKDELEMLFENFNVPSFNRDYLLRRKNIAEFYFLDKPLLVNELKWIV